MLKRIAPWLVTALLCGRVATAQITVTTFQQIAVSSTPVGIATATLNPGGGTAPMSSCIITPKDRGIVWRTDGDPTASTGTTLTVGQAVRFTNLRELGLLRMVSAAGDALVGVACYPLGANFELLGVTSGVAMQGSAADLVTVAGAKEPTGAAAALASSGGVLQVKVVTTPETFLPLCNAVRLYNCKK